MSQLQPTTKEFLASSDDAVEKAFFSRVFVPNRSVKTTYAKRLDDLNAVAFRHIAKINESPVKIMDVGMSSGISTAEWRDQLAAQQIDFDLTGTDLTIDALLYSYSNYGMLFDRKGNLLHFDLWGKGWPPHQRGIKFHYLRQLVTSSVFRCASAFGGKIETTPVKLLSRGFSDNGRCRAVEDDLAQANPPAFQRAFHVIRAANILNLAYFAESTLRTMLNTLKERLKDGGLLLVCRTDGATNNGTVFQLSSSRLVAVDRIGAGSEIEPLV
ncbi:MAG: hypothetical protein WBQ68_14905 [Terriglobales bacterium]